MARRDVLRRSAHKSIRGHYPVLPSAQSAQEVAGGMALRRDLQDTFAYLRQQNSLNRSQSMLQRLQVKREGQAGLQSQAGSALERGMLGSTSSNVQRALMRSDTAQQLQGVRNEQIVGQLGNAAQAQQGVRDYRTGLLNLMMASAAGKSDAAISKLLNATVNAVNGGGGGGGARRGGGGANESGGISPRLRGRLQARTGDIRSLLTQYEAIDPTSIASADQKVALQEQLKKLWMRRNKLRKKAGRDPLELTKLYEKLGLTAPEAPGGTRPGPQQ